MAEKTSDRPLPAARHSRISPISSEDFREPEEGSAKNMQVKRAPTVFVHEMEADG